MFTENCKSSLLSPAFLVVLPTRLCRLLIIMWVRNFWLSLGFYTKGIKATLFCCVSIEDRSPVKYLLSVLISYLSSIVSVGAAASHESRSTLLAIVTMFTCEVVPQI